jgi:hypothetical protein
MTTRSPYSPLSRKITFFTLIFLALSGFHAFSQAPVITVRFANPEYVCSTQTYSLDVEFQSNTTNKQLFMMNVRFYYNDSTFEFLSFGEFAQGYGASPPNPPNITTASPSSGMSLFGFAGAAEYVNGCVQRLTTSPVMLTTNSWTKIFNISFHVDDPEALNNANFCPPVIWDLKENPAEGGLMGGGGVTILVANGPTGSAPATENVVQFNWQYDGIPGYPFGTPVEIDCINTICAYAPETELPVFGFNSPGIIDLPVTVRGFENIGAFNLVFSYDPTVMTYVNNTPNEIFTTENGLLTVTDAPGTGGKNIITMLYEGSAISLSDYASITDLHFYYFSGTTELTWLTDDNQCWYADADYNPIFDEPCPDYYIDGMVVSLLAPLTKIDSIVAYNGDLVTFTVRVWNFKDIHCGTLTLNYNPEVLVFHNAVPDAAVNTSFVAEAATAGTLQMGWTGSDTSLVDGSIIMYLTFQYLSGSSALVWYDDGASCQYTTFKLFLPLFDEPIEDHYIYGNIASSVFTWTGDQSSDWSSETNWSDSNTPNQFVNVIIDPDLEPANWPIFNGDFTLGENCRNLTLNGNAQLTINGNFTINPGHTLNLSESGKLLVSGNWINSGIFNAGSGTVEFIGADDGIIGEGVPPGNYIAGYVTSTFMSVMDPLTGGIAGPAGDNTHSDVSIGFDFNFLGINYSQLRISTNGWISLNLSGDDAISMENTRLFNTSDPLCVLAPWWDDLKADENSSVKYLTEGTAPSRTFTVEWGNILAYSSGATTRLNFQVKLYETSHTIEFYYGTLTDGTHNAAESASIGLKDLTGGPGNFLEATQNSTNIILAALKSNANWPVINYRFSPPIEADFEIFHKIIVSKPSGKLFVQRDVMVTGKE